MTGIGGGGVGDSTGGFVITGGFLFLVDILPPFGSH